MLNEAFRDIVSVLNITHHVNATMQQGNMNHSCRKYSGLVGIIKHPEIEKTIGFLEPDRLLSVQNVANRASSYLLEEHMKEYINMLI